MIKTVFFDLDGVLTTDAKGSLTFSKNLCEKFPNLSVTDVLACYREDIELLNSGRHTLLETWRRLCRTFAIPEDEEMLTEILRKAPRNKVMFEFAKTLSPRYKLGIITDNTPERMEALNQEMKLDELFDPIVISAVEHASKCDGTTALFDAALVKARCRADEAVFIDNQKKNLITPAKMGMKTYWHDDAANDVNALRAVLREWDVA